MENVLKNLKSKIAYSFFSKNNNPTELEPNEITVWNEALKLCIGFIDIRIKRESKNKPKSTQLELEALLAKQRELLKAFCKSMEYETIIPEQIDLDIDIFLKSL